MLIATAVQLAQAAPLEEHPWRYRTDQPDATRINTDYDDSQWLEGFGGFGVRSTPGARVSTVWKTSDIWMRKIITLDEVPRNPALYVFHDEDSEIYINDQVVAKYSGFITKYVVKPLDKKAAAVLRKGRNVIAVHCRQSTGGQAIDVHLIDGTEAPELPPVRLPRHPFKSDLITEWGSKVTAKNSWWVNDKKVGSHIGGNLPSWVFFLLGLSFPCDRRFLPGLSLR